MAISSWDGAGAGFAAALGAGFGAVGSVAGLAAGAFLAGVFLAAAFLAGAFLAAGAEESVAGVVFLAGMVVIGGCFFRAEAAPSRIKHGLL